MFRGRDFEIFDEPGLEVPEGLRPVVGAEDQSAARAVASGGSARPISGGGDIDRAAAHGVHDRSPSQGRPGGWLGIRRSRRTAAVAAIAAAIAAAVFLLPRGDRADGSRGRPMAEHAALSAPAAPVQRGASRLRPRSRPRPSPATRRPERESPRPERGQAAATRPVLPKGRPPTPAPPSPPIAAVPAPAPARLRHRTVHSPRPQLRPPRSNHEHAAEPRAGLPEAAPQGHGLPGRPLPAARCRRPRRHPPGRLGCIARGAHSRRCRAEQEALRQSIAERIANAGELDGEERAQLREEIERAYGGYSPEAFEFNGQLDELDRAVSEATDDDTGSDGEEAPERK
jgi:hypothetical protein